MLIALDKEAKGELLGLAKSLLAAAPAGQQGTQAHTALSGLVGKLETEGEEVSLEDNEFVAFRAIVKMVGDGILGGNQFGK